MEGNNFQIGEEVYVIYRNPHAANVANIEKAEIVEHPNNPKELALFLHDAYHPLADDDAVFSSFDEAEELYNQLFDYQQYD
ncbi:MULTISPECIES: transcriptional regulator SplA domain-containing protein [Metabacillus]|uniref:Transcriptional regulator n=3 Tax=Metabacillus TaxID=2675233 RepID=A0A179SYG8_9BACI|nr:MULTISPECIES: transcriptional regulator SplA domain-containing protein [Metabacillus]OAS86665.1 transcriptional regulator [Metabacillus litoralis]QNF29265.1 transcriptional regulator [Metabacillus sp. KUDC1714]